MGEELTYRGKLKTLDIEVTKKGNPYLALTLDDKPFRYFEGDEEHMEETANGLRPYWNEEIEVTYTERKIEGRKYPYRNIKGFNLNFTPANELDKGQKREAGEAAPKKPAAPAKATSEAPEETISDEADDPDVQLYQKCLRLSALAWQPQLNEWKAAGVKIGSEALMRRIGETATSFYITKVKQRY